MENKLLNNKENSKSKDLRDYDKEPIIIKDKLHEMLIIQICISTLFLIFVLSLNIPMDRKMFLIYTSILVDIKTLREMSFRTKIYIKNNFIEKRKDNILVAKINIENIDKIYKTLDSALPKNNFDINGSKMLIIFAIFYFSILVLTDGVLFMILVILYLIAICVIGFLLPQFFVHWKYKAKNTSWFYDMLFLKDKNGNFLNFLITDDKEYGELKEYFWQKSKINLDNTIQKISAIYEIKKQDLKHF
ncbi:MULTISPECIES: hypothetical protein [unclassified Campylobacter]|uniref:hypothetical protein n=1 Tax=unclassified Campylobacter TaxID=2593542 RepID=UPI0022E9FF21|nr:MULTISPECIES: hypothetical protein [unclassified Campylobacter]MDA3056799.1 hypothetical protein [Campylobacter sp. CN_NA1]MDA3066009.1 hypothetical protein [Campylobacter sp. CN_NE4]MDA3069319.1 hypothetical protein [Campylobacter sp. CN_NE3]MDA3083335.1 hypothetical protein [Campylobacter sp. CN_EL2]MDA3084825.1 hypothetical protein [Campylobacter sp. CN_NE1]